jgi:hypothetical protein
MGQQSNIIAPLYEILETIDIFELYFVNLLKFIQFKTNNNCKCICNIL